MTRSAKKHVDVRSAEGVCLVPGCKCKAVSRGLCATHRAQYYRDLYRHPTAAKRAAFERNAIQQGLILPAGRQRELQSKSPFASAHVG